MPKSHFCHLFSPVCYQLSSAVDTSGKNPQKIALKPGRDRLSEFDPATMAVSIISLFAANPDCDAGPILCRTSRPVRILSVFLSTFHDEILRAGMRDFRQPSI